MAQEEERLSGALQENILTVLCFDDAHCRLVRAAVTPQLFESAVFREVAGHAIDFVDQFGEAIKEHLPDHLEHILKGEDQRKANTYERLLANLYLSRDSVNAEYVVSQLHKFVRLQRFKSGLTQAIEAVEDGRLDEAEVKMQAAMRAQSVAFEKGMDLSDPAQLALVFEKPEEEGFELGIPEFDSRGIIPRRGELFCLLAPRKRGKSWFLTHVQKQAILQRWRALLVTVELSERASAVRMIQSFLSVSRKKGETMVTKLVRDRGGRLSDVVSEEVERLSIGDSEDRPGILRKAKREFGKRTPFVIKEFPMGSLTMPELEAYLDGLERYENFVPDVILVDYPRRMKLDPDNLRIALGQLFADLRGLGKKRNAAVVIVHQGNRVSERAALVTGDMAEEDISLVAVVDALVTYSQTKAERRLGLARLYAEYVRNAESEVQVLITQSYPLGQFCLDSMRVGQDYWDVMKEDMKEDSRDGPAQEHDDERH